MGKYLCALTTTPIYQHKHPTIHQLSKKIITFADQYPKGNHTLSKNKNNKI